MNFLLHRHLGMRDLGSEAAGLGAMLPDLWGMADRRVRPVHGTTTEGAPRPLGELLAGIEHHLVADRWFHTDAVFKDGEREAALRLREAKLTARHSAMFAHVLWEMCLDGELVRRDRKGRILTELRFGMRDAETALDESVDLHHFGRVARTLAEREAFLGRLRRICDELVRGPWIDGYRSGAGIAVRVQGVRTRLGLLAMSAADEARLAAVAGGLLGLAVDAVDRIVATPSFALPVRVMIASDRERQ
jgi:hypothetical protein